MLGEFYYEVLFVWTVPEDKKNLYYHDDNPTYIIKNKYEYYMAYKYISDILECKEYSLEKLDFNDINLKKSGIENNLTILYLVNDILIHDIIPEQKCCLIS